MNMTGSHIKNTFDICNSADIMYTDLSCIFMDDKVSK